MPAKRGRQTAAQWVRANPRHIAKLKAKQTTAQWVRANPRPVAKLISKLRKKGAGSKIAGRVKRKRKKASGSNVAGRVRRKPVKKGAGNASRVAGLRKKLEAAARAGKYPSIVKQGQRIVQSLRASGSNVAGRVRRKPVKKGAGNASRVAGLRKKLEAAARAGRVRRKPVRRKRASGSMVAGGKWKDRLTYVPNKIVEHTFGRLAKSIWKRNRRR